MLTKNELTAAVSEVYDDRARLAEELRINQDKTRAMYKRFGDKLGCLPNYTDVDAAIDAMIAENKRIVAELAAGTVG